MKSIHTDKAPKAIGPYVQGNIVNGLLFASGQVPLSPETGEVIGSTIEEQTEQVLKNIAAILKEVGSDFNQVVKTTCFLKNMNDFAAFNEVYAGAFKTQLPARSAVEVARLPKDVLIEIEIIASVNE
ncbi:regulator [Enterococcus plantarum]|uniref:RidA family protein n=1 Tax=Enterococcus plantarum TaxID=1077675 RepID=A0A2W3Z0F5_9ENTE|nr:RidA family protein [Enterococcus plantarum]MBO0423564.1 RidA family protein [Enterococcus plantarum]MBO0468448.1 RidA family protein [Enterococcus plantarum]OEG21076.1 regulator [Enterococcus plantarum]PZL73356.1 RidA family protein [Enterococcus plantarum]